MLIASLGMVGDKDDPTRRLHLMHEAPGVLGVWLEETPRMAPRMVVLDAEGVLRLIALLNLALVPLLEEA